MPSKKQAESRERYTTDTQSFLWYLTNAPQLSKIAKEIFERTDNGKAKILIPIVSLFEIFQKIWKRRIPFSHIDEIMIRIKAINERYDEPPYEFVPLDLKVLDKRIELSQENIPNKEKVKDRDLQIVAIALVNETPLITKDFEIEKSGLIRVVRSKK